MYKHFVSQMSQKVKDTYCFLHENFLNDKVLEERERWVKETGNLKKDFPAYKLESMKDLTEREKILLLDAEKICKSYAHMPDSTALEMEACFLANGPKLYQLQPSTCEALENVYLTFGSDQYEQPFPMICLDYTQEHVENRFIRNNIFLSGKDGDGKPYNLVPDYALLKYKKRPEFLSLYLLIKLRNLEKNSEYVGKYFCLHLCADYQESIEKAVQDRRENNTAFSLEEIKFQESVLRTMCNLSMLVVQNGHTEIPDAYREKLVEKVQSGQGKKEMFELKTRPQNFTLNQDIDLFRRKDVYVRSGNKTGKKVRPHWRNGHWRSQRHGEKWSLLKQIFVEPVYVNVKYLEGSLSDTMVNYREG